MLQEVTVAVPVAHAITSCERVAEKQEPAATRGLGLCHFVLAAEAGAVRLDQVTTVFVRYPSSKTRDVAMAGQRVVHEQQPHGAAPLPLTAAVTSPLGDAEDGRRLPALVSPLNRRAQTSRSSNRLKACSSSKASR